MFTVRPTRKLAARLNQAAGRTTPTTTRLGDWHANVLFERDGHLVLFTSEKTLLPVLVPARELKTLVPRFRVALGEMLRALGVPASVATEEDVAMEEVAFGKAQNRVVLGSMNDFMLMFRYTREQRTATLLEESLQLAKSPCSPIGMKSPERLTLEVLTQRR